MRSGQIASFIVFLLVVGAVDASLHVYLYRRLIRRLTERPFQRRLGMAGMALLALLLVGGPFAARMAPGGLSLALSRASYLWWALAFYLFVGLAAVDVVGFLVARVRHRPPPDPARSAALARVAAGVAAAVALVVTSYGVFRAWAPPDVSEVEVKLPRLPSALSGFTLVQLSDIHVGAWVDRGFVEDLVARANALAPDAVVITGDLVDGSVEDLLPLAAPLASLRARHGVYFVTGNHEYYSGAEEWTAALRAMGITVLRNARAEVGGPEASFDLVGVDDWTARGRGLAGGHELDAALAGRDPTRAAVLLAHQPRGIKQAAARGIGLQLSGHTHGGQIWPWSYAVRAVFPYFSGRYQAGEMTVYVSRGSGFWGPPVRVGAAPEIARIVLR